MTLQTDQQMILGALRAAQRLLAESVAPDRARDDRETISKLLDILDDERLNAAIDRAETRAGMLRRL